jgi:glycolate oxidase iron-sulfur subunit
MLERLLTDLGERSGYDAASQCSRCGYCEQACPTYVATGREAFSPRGRNQLVRALIEGKLENPADAEQALSTCLLCSACTTICPASVPTADLVLEGRRMLRGETIHWVPRTVSRLLVENPRLFDGLVRWGNRFHRWGLARLAARTGLLDLFGLGPLARAILHLDDAPASLLRDRLRARTPEHGDAWEYFTACGTNFLFPEVGEASLKVLKSTRGRGKTMENACCGLLSFNYGSLDDARALAKKNIERFEREALPEDSPLVADCSSCVSFLKSYPQLFLDDAPWRERAEKFSARVRDFSETLDPEVLPEGGASDGVVTIHDACRARNGQGIVEEPRAAVKKLAGSRCRELGDGGDCCGGAGAFSFTHPELSDELLRAKIAAIADAQAATVLASSTSCLLQIMRGLKVYYPECRVVHLSQWVDESLPERK